MSDRVTGVWCTDIRFPTSRTADGSDAMNPDPDYSAAYVVLETESGAQGHAFVFTIGRGNEVQAAAIRCLDSHLLGWELHDLVHDMGSTSRRLIYDSQIRWLGPEKGVMHMAIGALLNALWDIKAKQAGLPLWELLARMSPSEIVDLVDFRYLTDALPPSRAMEILQSAESGRAARTAALLRDGYPAYTTTPGWIGYSDEKMARLAGQAAADGFRQIKLKVGENLDDDRRRLAVARTAVGPDIRIAIDANQRWDVGTAISWIQGLAEFGPHWIEEPTSPDDILGHAAIRRAVSIPIATGEQAHSRVMFKQLLQAGAVDFVQIDAVRVGGVNENIAILLLAAAFDKPVCPHAGGVGLCETVQHLSMFDFVAVSGSVQNRVIEYVDHLHEHFVNPVQIVNGNYQAPRAPGSSAEMLIHSRTSFSFPDGTQWRQLCQ